MPRTCALLLLLIAATNLVAADSRLGNDCDLQELDIHDKAEFLRFDHDLRYALENGNAAALALLVQFPLRVNDADGSRIMLRDAATLQKQFDHVFPRTLRDAVKKQSHDDMFCKYTSGVAYDNGNIWANLAGAANRQFRIVAVNVPGTARFTRKVGDMDLACSTKQFHIAIDFADTESKVRYRAWNLPRSIADKPDLELTGTRDVEGTGPCTHRVWRFKNANAEYELSEPGCGQDSPPKNAAAQLTVNIDGQTKLESWCF